MFDFDQTLSVIHVFKTLAGWTSSSHGMDRPLVPKPFATSERGQVCRIGELNNLEAFESMGFACAAFGGAHRVREVHELLEHLHGLGVEMMVCTKGLVGAVRRCLSDLGMLEFFSRVYGNTGSGYGETEYDREIARTELDEEERSYLGGASASSWGSKDRLIAKLMAQRSLGRHQAVLVEDDPEEIRRAKGTCRTLWVRAAAGMTAEHFAELRDMAGGVGEQPMMPGGARGMRRAEAPPRPHHAGTPQLRRTDSAASGASANSCASPSQLNRSSGSAGGAAAIRAGSSVRSGSARRGAESSRHRANSPQLPRNDSSASSFGASFSWHDVSSGSAGDPSALRGSNSGRAGSARQAPPRECRPAGPASCGPRGVPDQAGRRVPRPGSRESRNTPLRSAGTAMLSAGGAQQQVAVDL